MKYPLEIVEGDLSSREFLRQALKSFDLVIHVASKVSDWGSYGDFFETNVLGSENLIEAIPPAARMIYISSNAVLGEEDSKDAKPEAAPYRPVLDYFLERLIPSGMNHYRLTKALAEQLLIHRAGKKNIDLTVIRPVWVYGPREFHAGPYEYCKTVLTGIPLIPGTTDNFFHVIFVEDLARIVHEVARRQPRGVTIYHSGGSIVPLMESYWETFCRALGVEKPRNLPKFLVYPFALLLEAIWHLAGSRNPPLFTRARLYMFYASNVYGTEALKKDFHLEARTPLEKGIKKTVRWWRLYGFLN